MLQQDRSTSSKYSRMESPQCGCSIVAPTALRSALILSQPEPFSQAHLTLFLTITNNKIFQCLCPTQWRTTSFRILTMLWLSNTGSNSQTFRRQRTFLEGFAAALLDELVMPFPIPNPRSRTFLCLPTPSGPNWSKKCWMTWSHTDAPMPLMLAFVTTLLGSMRNLTRHASIARKLASPLPEFLSDPSMNFGSRKWLSMRGSISSPSEGEVTHVGKRGSVHPPSIQWWHWALSLSCTNGENDFAGRRSSVTAMRTFCMTWSGHCSEKNTENSELHFLKNLVHEHIHKKFWCDVKSLATVGRLRLAVS